MGVVKDITERKRAELLLETEFAVTRVLVESATLPEATPRLLQAICECAGWDIGELWWVDPHAKVLRWGGAWHKPSPKAARFEWLSRGVTFSPSSGLPGRVWASRRQEWIADVLTDANFVRGSSAAEAGLHAAFAFPILGEREVVAVMTFFGHDTLEPDDELLELMTDIGRRIGQYSDHKRAEETLRESQKRYHTLAEVSPAGIFHTDANGDCLYVNERWSEIAGLTLQEALGEGWARGLHPDDRERVFHEWHRAATENRPFQSEYRFQRPDGVATWVFGQAVAETNPDGEAVGYVGTITDITKRKRLEEELIRSERVWAVGEMAAGVAHNFNNVLAVVLGRAGFLLLQLEEGKAQFGEARQNLVVIERAALNGAAMVHRLLEFARNTPQGEEAVTVDVEELLTHTLELSRHRWKDEAEAQGRHIQVVLKPDHVPPVLGHPTELQEVLLCLILNAIDAMPQGGTLTLSTWAEEGRVCLGVKDTGIGIPEEIQARVFEPFFTTKGPQSTGLGLSVGYGIIQRHEGEIVVDSQPGHGTTFTVKLPARASPAPRVDLAATTPRGTTPYPHR
ncbi:MAG: PAS domain S-box protein [Candidatus Methylomirabilia bacterium]